MTKRDREEGVVRDDGATTPKPRAPSWESFFENAPPVDDDFLRDRHDPPAEERELFGR